MSLAPPCPNTPCRKAAQMLQSHKVMSTGTCFGPRDAVPAVQTVRKRPILPAQRLCPKQRPQGIDPVVPELWDHCTLSQDEARVPPEQQRAQTHEKKEGGMLGS